MPILGGEVGYKVLRNLWPAPINNLSGKAYSRKDKLRVLLGENVYQELHGKVVVDFGCGEGLEAVHIARHGAKRVIGLDIQERLLEFARRRARENGVGDRCEFAPHTTQKCDVVISLDSFEHFEDPVGVLGIMRNLLKPGGYVWASFGPTWYHPYGGHMFSPFPWAHVLFTEQTLVRRRSELKRDNIRGFHDVPEGLGQMTIRRFVRVVEEAEFEFLSFEPVPIRKLKYLANRLTREFTTSVVRCKIRPKSTH